jgi:hypothetical protein
MPEDNKILYPAQLGLRNYGILQVQVVDQMTAYPIVGALIQIYQKDNLTRAIETLTTDISGKTIEIELVSPPLEYSLEPTRDMPYLEYPVMASAEGYQTVLIDSAQVLPFVKSIQPVRMIPFRAGMAAMQVIPIDYNYLIGTYTPKVYEAEIKPMPPGQEDKPVVIPEFITVHNAIPSNITAPDYRVEYPYFIKNVVSSILFATWPRETIYAGILMILSFSLNRVYTNWYPRQGYKFDITSTAAFDNKWLYGRNIYTNISEAVDYIFNNYLSRPDVLQPILTQSCRGELAICPGMLSLWESKFLGDAGYTAVDILHKFYGNDLYINSTDNIEGVEANWPGMDLTIGSSGDAVTFIQNQLNSIAIAYPAISETPADGIYGPVTEAAVSKFQEIFTLPVTGITDKGTWYKINRVNARLGGMNSKI